MRLPWLLALTLTAAAGERPHALVSYSFEEDVDTGPDTFAIWQHAKGTVRLSSEIRLSGYRSVEIKDVPHDGTFPELQGYFEPRRRGRLYAHFALLTADASQDFNVALAGPAHFTIRRDGIAFWLAARGGSLVHYPATQVVGTVPLAGVGRAVPTPLLKLEPFLWYVVDVAYDIDAGLYDLTVRQEGRAEPVVRRSAQRNSAGRPGSAVDKFSFIGDLDDAFAAAYYVDDIVIGTDERIAQLPFAAPGRRRLFVERFADAARQARQRSCLPMLEPSDFGLTAADLQALKGAGLLESLAALAAGGTVDPARLLPLPADTRRRMEAGRAWSEGCAALGGEPARALLAFDAAARTAPEARLAAPSAVLALLRLRRWPEMERRLEALGPGFREDPRYGVLLSIVGAERGGLEQAEAWLRGPAEGGGSGPGQPLVAEAYYYVLLAKEEYALAQEYAERLARRQRASPPAAGAWLERAGDAALALRRLPEARELYERSRLFANTTSVWLKLSDVAFLEGDLATERSVREAIYGRLE
jgi:hypothetical protein